MTKQSLGGKARAESMTPEERSAAAKRAADRRWGGDGQLVYVIGPDVGPQKIGIAARPALRRHQLQIGNPSSLVIALQFDPEERSALEVERRTHQILAGHSLRGEWFDVTQEQAVAAVHEALASLRAGKDRVPYEPTRPVTLRVPQSIFDRFEAELGDGWRKVLEASLVAAVSPGGELFVGPIAAPRARAEAVLIANVRPEPAAETKAAPIAPVEKLRRAPAPYGSRLKKR